MFRHALRTHMQVENLAVALCTAQTVDNWDARIGSRTREQDAASLCSGGAISKARGLISTVGAVISACLEIGCRIPCAPGARSTIARCSAGPYLWRHAWAGRPVVSIRLAGLYSLLRLPLLPFPPPQPLHSTDTMLARTRVSTLARPARLVLRGFASTPAVAGEVCLPFPTVLIQY